MEYAGRNEEVMTISRQILAYLLENSDAQDTLDGIVEWWLLRQRIRVEIQKVKQAVTELVETELLLKHQSADTRTFYRINRGKYEEIRAFIEQAQGMG